MNKTLSPAVQQLISSAESLENDGKISEAFFKYEEIIEALLFLDDEDEIKEIYKKISHLNSSKFNNTKQKKRQLIFIDILKAENLYQQGLIDATLKILEEIKKEYPSNPEVLTKMGSIYERQNQKEKAIENYFAAAKYYHNHRFFKKALFFAQKAKNIAPQKKEIKILLSEIYIKEDSREEARKELIDLIKNLIQQNDFDEALKYVQKALQVDGIETLYLEGIIWFHKGLLEAAEQKFKLVTRLKGGHFGSLCYLGEIHLKQKLFQQAFNDYQKAFTLRPWDPQIYHKLAEINLQKEEGDLPPSEKPEIESPSVVPSSKTEESFLPFDSSPRVSPEKESSPEEESSPEKESSPEEESFPEKESSPEKESFPEEESFPEKESSSEEIQTYLIESEFAMHEEKSLSEMKGLYEFAISLEPTNEKIVKKLQAIKMFQKEKGETHKKLKIINKNFDDEFWPLSIVEIAEFPFLLKKVITLYRSFLENSSDNELLNRLNKVQLLSNKNYLDLKITS